MCQGTEADDVGENPCPVRVDSSVGDQLHIKLIRHKEHEMVISAIENNNKQEVNT